MHCLGSHHLHFNLLKTVCAFLQSFPEWSYVKKVFLPTIKQENYTHSSKNIGVFLH